MDERNERVIRSFINIVEKGVKDYDSAVILMEDMRSYPYLTEADKKVFYDAFRHDAPPVIEPIPDPDLGLGEIPPTD